MIETSGICLKELIELKKDLPEVFEVSTVLNPTYSVYIYKDLYYFIIISKRIKAYIKNIISKKLLEIDNEFERPI